MLEEDTQRSRVLRAVLPECSNVHGAPVFSARARKTTPGAGALPGPKIITDYIPREHNGMGNGVIMGGKIVGGRGAGRDARQDTRDACGPWMGARRPTPGISSRKQRINGWLKCSRRDAVNSTRDACAPRTGGAAASTTTLPTDNYDHDEAQQRRTTGSNARLWPW